MQQAAEASCPRSTDPPERKSTTSEQPNLPVELPTRPAAPLRSDTLARMGGVPPSTSETSSVASSTPATESTGRPHTIRIGAVVALALAAAFVAWLFVADDDARSPTSAGTTTLPSAASALPASETRPQIATVARLHATAASSSLPIYWVGARPRTRIELTRAPGGTIFVRYLPGTARAGDLRAFLTVATYPRASAFAEVTRASKTGDAETIRLAGGGLAVYNGDESTNVHIAYPAQPYQIEVFAPSPGAARELVASGAVRPV